ncbi:MAG: hypothetical protein ACRDFB_10115, partial [Rhabdochlamydiaceae bacterium]
IRFLIRNNLRDSIYNKEILRSNRIGLGISEIIEWAWVRFGFTLKDLLDECKSNKFWKAISKFSKISKEEANSYSNYLGLNQPSTVLILNINEKFIELENAENQYRFIQLLEAFWLGTTQSGQIGWNLKIDTNQYSLDEYKKLILENQPLIKA